MTCCGEREKGPVSSEEMWDNINLVDFKSESCISPFSFFLIYVFLLISLAVYAVDTFTAVNLLAFSRWQGQIEPAIPFHVSRWIFAVCIIISFVLLIIRWVHAIRAMRSGSIARSYLDSLAVRIQSIRMGRKGRGWRRFLVFAELTKSKKGAEYVALFAYFSFENWMNTVFADGPRQVVNAITLYSVMQLDLLPGGANVKDTSSNSSAILQFFNNIKIMAEENNLQALVLFGMLFTLVIWVLSILKLALAVILYLIFLWHHIPSEDGTLRAYCRRKINARLVRIVRQKVTKALAKGVALQDRTPTNVNMGINRKPTLPSVGDFDGDKTPILPSISRSTTQTTLPPYSSRPGTAAPDRKPTLPDLSLTEKPPLSRTATHSSAYSEETSLSGTTAVSAYSPLDHQSSYAPPVPPLPTNFPLSGMRSNTPMSRPPTTRPTFTPDSQFNNDPLTGVRSNTPMSRPPTTRPNFMPDASFGEDPLSGVRSNTPMSRPPTTRPNFMPDASFGEDPVSGVRSNTPMSRPPTTRPNFMPDASFGDDPLSGVRSNTPMSRPPTTRPNFTPAPPSSVNAPGRMASVTGYRDSHEDPYSYDESHDAQSDAPYQSYSPAADPYSRSLTSGVAGEAYPARAFSPQSQSGTPQPPPSMIPQAEYPARSFTPASQGTGQQMHSVSSQADYPIRSFTPASQGSGRPPLAVNTEGGLPRTLSPVLQSGTPRPERAGGYVAFDPSSMNASSSGAGAPTSNSPVYQPYTRSGSVPPSNDHNSGQAPVRAYSPPSHSPQPQPYRRDYH